MKELEVNKLIQLRLVDGDSSHSYVSRVDDIRDNQIYIAWPTDGGMQAPVRKGDTLAMSFTREDAIYDANVRVDATQAEPQPLLVIRVVGQVKRTQRRENVRVRVNVPMELMGAMQVEGRSAPVVIHIKANVLDFSGGGFSLQHKEEIPLGTLLESRFSLPGINEPFKLAVKVVRCGAEPDIHGGHNYRLGVMFLDMHESIRSRMIRFVFGAQNTVIRR
jgi:c-di-GMP-binding flagellar brake protein YcgR